MAVIEVNGSPVELDEDGFMMDPDCWSEDVARAFAPAEGVGELTEAHWKVIRYLRDYYRQFQIAPMIRKMCKETGNTLQGHVRTVSDRSRQGRLPAGRAAQTDGVRLACPGSREPSP